MSATVSRAGAAALLALYTREGGQGTAAEIGAAGATMAALSRRGLVHSTSGWRVALTGEPVTWRLTGRGRAAAAELERDTRAVPDRDAMTARLTAAMAPEPVDAFGHVDTPQGAAVVAIVSDDRTVGMAPGTGVLDFADPESAARWLDSLAAVAAPVVLREHQPYMPGQGPRATYTAQDFPNAAAARAWVSRARREGYTYTLHTLSGARIGDAL